METFNALLKKFGQHGEKSGWTYFELSAEIASRIKPGYKRSFRVKGKIDKVDVKGLATIPIGDGNFIVSINAPLRRLLGKSQGDQVSVKLTEDKEEYRINESLLECLRDEPRAFEHFNKMPPSHQKYYSRWIESARTNATQIKRIALTVNSLARGMNFGEMIRSQKELGDQ